MIIIRATEGSGQNDGRGIQNHLYILIYLHCLNLVSLTVLSSLRMQQSFEFSTRYSLLNLKS